MFRNCTSGASNLCKKSGYSLPLILFCYVEIDKLAAKNNVGIATLQHILDGLRQPTDHDIRVSK